MKEDEIEEDEMDAEDAEELGIHQGLASTYSLLGELYLHPPSKEVVDALTDTAEALAESTDGFPRLREAVDTLLDVDADVEELRPEYTRVFQGLTQGESPPPPYESLYRDGTVNGPSSVEVERKYMEAGVELAREDTLVDHAGYELQFVSVLCRRGEAGQLESFLGEHLLEWLPEFHAAARDRDAAMYYQAVFELVEAVLELHAEAIAEEEI